MKKYCLFITLIICLFVQPVFAKTILYVPADDRPVSLDYVVDTAKAAGFEIITPNSVLVAGRTNPGNPDYLWAWVLSHCNDVDAMVISADSLLYGGLVASRTHHYDSAALQERLANFEKLKSINPGANIYVYSTIMRTPVASAGGTEPPYYEKYGPSIFQITALRDKKDLGTITKNEELQLHNLLSAVPQDDLADWYSRRDKNYQLNVGLIGLLKDRTFDYLIQGRDDCSPFSQSHMESRWLSRETNNLPASKYACFPGADQLGMLLVARAINNLNNRMPVVSILYSPGAGGSTVPTYEDKELSETINAQIISAGGVALPSPRKPDMLLAVSTPENGITLEASNPLNKDKLRPSVAAFVRDLEAALSAKKRVSVASIAFSNGADNALMAELSKRKMFFKLAAFSGWNTASNTLGYAIGQGMLAPTMTTEAKNKLIMVRVLEDWVYQANIRAEVAEKILWPLGGNYFYLDDIKERMIDETTRRMQLFAQSNIQGFTPPNFSVSFPWNRMFEIKVEVN